MVPGASTLVPKAYGYKTTDTLAAVLGAGYFNSQVNDTRLQEGDTIYLVYDTDGTPGSVNLHVIDITTAGAVVVAAEYLDGSKALDAGSIAKGNEETTEVTVTGAVLGDFAIASLSIDVEDLMLAASVTAANTVTAQLLNNTSGAVDLASATVRVRVYPLRVWP